MQLLEKFFPHWSRWAAHQKSARAFPKSLAVGDCLELNSSSLNRAGFTLIEVLIYVALFGIIMGSLSVAVYGIVEASGRGDTRVVMQEEGGFLLGKLDWALSGVSNLTVVAAPPGLTITKYGFGANPLVFNTAASNLRLQEGGGAFVDLNSSSVQVINFTVTNIPASNGKPQGVTVAFTLRGTTPKGVTIDQSFTLTKFLRK